MSVLLRQPYGLKSVLAHRKELETGSLAVTHGPKMCDTYLDSRAAAPGSGSYPQEYHDLIATQEELFWLRGHFLERFQFILKRAPDILAPAICSSPGIPIRNLVFEVRVRITKGGIPVSTTDGLVHPAERLNVCLRHGPRSIPQAQESA